MSTTVHITVDMNLCESHGQCVFAAPEVFSFDDDYLVHDAEPAPATHRSAMPAWPRGCVRRGFSDRLPDPGQRRHGQDLVRTPLPDEAAVVEQEAGVRRARHLEVVRGLDDGDPVGDECRQQCPDPLPRLGIQAGGRLVEEQQVRLLCQSLGNEGALTLPARELAQLT